ncbi:hypothetical protein M5K25_017138 [Dendrobium thyrsiflorum]|uniref:Uracil-DNA glycosylase n=1 Tax=Dendrobium thyrsiflorum TaxID=117978 RepID=A0ABD0UTN6_DENTH
MFEVEGIVIEGDNKNVMDWLKKSMMEATCRQNSVLKADLAFLMNFHNVIIHFVYRNCNKASDLCAGLVFFCSILYLLHQANSHARKGWEPFTDAVIRTISEKKRGIVFILWGNSAQEKSKLIDATKHHILKAAHPSGLSANRGFFGCRHFSKTNEMLKRLGLSPIDWQL